MNCPESIQTIFPSKNRNPDHSAMRQEVKISPGHEYTVLSDVPAIGPWEIQCGKSAGCQSDFDTSSGRSATRKCHAESEMRSARKGNYGCHKIPLQESG